MRWLALALLLSTAAEALPLAYPRGCRDRSCVRGRAVQSSSRTVYPTYEFDVASSSLGAACACTSVTLPTGEVITDERDGGAMCSKGNWLTGIATGDLVWCPTKTPRVMSGDDGGLGFLSEGATTNAISTQNMTGAPWATASTVVATPTISPPDAGPCPDGTITATRIQTPAVTSAQYSFAYDLTGCPNGGTTSLSAYVRGYSFDGGTDLVFVPGSGSAVALRRDYSVNSWTRILDENFPSDSQAMDIGARPVSLAVPIAEPASDFFVCFIQCESGDHATSFTPSTRKEDYISVGVQPPTMSDLQMSAEVLSESAVPNGSYPVALAATYATWLGAQTTALDAGMFCRDTWSSIDEYVPDGGSLGHQLPVSSLMCGWEANGAVSGIVPYSGVVDACLNGACTDGGVTNTPLSNIATNSLVLELGGHMSNVSPVGQPDGIIRNIRLTSQARETVFIYGDSIVGGAHQSETIHNQFNVYYGASLSAENHAQSGWTIDQCWAAWSATTAAIRAHPENASKTWMLVQCGTNSADDAGGTVFELESMLEDGRDAGVHPVWATITARDDHCPYVMAVNVAMRSFTAARGFPDSDSFSPLHGGGYAVGQAGYDGGCNALSQYVTDSLHPNDAGTVVMWNAWNSVAGW